MKMSRHPPEKPANQRIEAESTSCWQAGVGASLEKPGMGGMLGVHLLHLPFFPNKNATQEALCGFWGYQ